MIWPPSGLDTVVVLGNSGSLLSLPPQREWRADAVLGVSRILRTGQDGRRWYPDAVVVSDARVLETDSRLLLDYPGPVVCADYLGTDLATDWFQAVPVRSSLKSRPIPHFHNNKAGDPVWSIASVAFHAAQLAARMLRPGGRVVLAGCEARWPPRGDHRRPLHHYYSDSTLHRNLRPFPVNSAYQFQWGVFSCAMRERGLHIYESSPWADLRLVELEHINFEEAVCRI